MAEEVAPTRKRMDVDFDGQSPSTRWVVIDVNNDPLGVPNVYLCGHWLQTEHPTEFTDQVLHFLKTS